MSRNKGHKIINMKQKRKNKVLNIRDIDSDSGCNSNNSDNSSVSSNSDDENEIETSDTQTSMDGGINRLVIKVFQKGLVEERNPCVLVIVKKTIREKIFPMIKFVDNDVLKTVKIRENNNILHVMLQDLNRLDDDDVKRAKFWLAYQKEIKNVLTTRKTEVSNQMKDTVVTGKQNIKNEFLLCIILKSHLNTP